MASSEVPIRFNLFLGICLWVLAAWSLLPRVRSRNSSSNSVSVCPAASCHHHTSSGCTAIEGQSATLQVIASDTAPLSYQWQRSGTNIPGANSSTYTIANVLQGHDLDIYRCVVSNAYGTAISNGAILIIEYPPSINAQPLNQTVIEGQSATFQVAAGGTTPLSYQWQRNTVNISGANSQSYTVSSPTLVDSGAKFRCVVSNAFVTAISNEVTLSVTPPPPTVLTEASGNLGIAFDSVTMMRDPFPLFTTFNFSADHRTRIMLIATDTELLPGKNSSAVTAQAEDSLLMLYPLTVEFVGISATLGHLASSG